MADVNVSFGVIDEGNGFARLQAINSELDKTKIAGQNSAIGTKAASFSMTDLWSAVNLARQGLQYLEGAYSATGGEALAYAQEVKSLQSVSEASAEETSRFIQVLDDYKLTTQDALIATKALTKNGHAPTIETLAQLADEYNSLNSVEEKNQFILKNLGKGGLEWARVLQQGSAALREQGNAVNKNLILTQEQVDAAEDYRLALDQWNDSVQALKISIGNELLPVMTDMLDSLNEHQRAAQILAEQGLTPDIATTKEYKAALEQARQEQEASADSARNTAGALGDEATAAENLVDPLKAAKDALKEMSDANRDYISGVMSFASDQESYEKNRADALDKIAEAQDRLTQATHEYGVNSKQWLDASAEVDKATQDLEELGNAWQETQNKMAFDVVMQHFQKTGDMLDDVETKALATYGEQLGLFSDAQAKQYEFLMSGAQAQIDATEGSKEWLDQQAKINDQLGAGKTEAENYGTALVDAHERAAQAADYLLQVEGAIGQALTDNVSIASGLASAFGGGVVVGGGGGGGGGTKHASGGSFVIPAGYENERWMLGGGNTASSGETVTVSPAGQQAGASVINNITINNPVPVAAENDISKELKSLSYLGVFGQ